MSNSSARRVHPMSRPTKCGASKISGTPRAASKCSMPRCAPAAGCARAIPTKGWHARERCGRRPGNGAGKRVALTGCELGQQRARLIRQTRRRSRPNAYSSVPKPLPVAASADSGSSLSSQTQARATRVSMAIDGQKHEGKRGGAVQMLIHFAFSPCSSLIPRCRRPGGTL